MAHARRKFDQDQDSDRTRAEQALKLFQPLYEIEREPKMINLTPVDRKSLRQEKSIKPLSDLHEWLMETSLQVLPKSVIGQAIAYTLKLWPRLIRYTENGLWEIDNNLAENSIMSSQPVSPRESRK